MQSCSAPTPAAKLCAYTDHASNVGSLPPMTPHAALQSVPPATPKHEGMPSLGFPIQQERVASRSTPKSASILFPSKHQPESEVIGHWQRLLEQQDLILRTQGKLITQMDEKEVGFRRWVELLIHQKQGELWMQLEQHHSEVMTGLATQFRKGPSPQFEKRSLEILQKANLNKNIIRTTQLQANDDKDKERRVSGKSHEVARSSKAAACANIFRQTRSNTRRPSMEVLPVFGLTDPDSLASPHAQRMVTKQSENVPKLESMMLSPTDGMGWQTAMNGLNLPASWPTLHERIKKQADTGDSEAKKVSCTQKIVASTWFETMMTLVIVANLVNMFLQLEFREVHLAFKLNLRTTDTSWLDAKEAFELTEYLFCTIYVVELLLRLYALGIRHFCDTLVLADTVIVIVTSVETYLFPAFGWSADNTNLAFARIVRLFRLARIVKVIRFAKSFTELRIIIRTVAACSRALVSSMLLISLIIVAGGILMVQILVAFVEDSSNDYGDRLWAYEHYGSASKAAYSIFEATFTPFWATDSRRMIERFDPLYAVFWCFWAVAINFAVMHVIGAIFLKQTMVFMAEDADRMELQQISKKESYAQRLRETFKDADPSGDGHISIDEFQALIFNPKIHESFEALDLELFEVVALFKLLADDNGEANCEEFLQGAMKLKNNASTIDAIQILHMIAKLQKQIDGVAELVIVAGLEGPAGGVVEDDSSPRSNTSPGFAKANW